MIIIEKNNAVSVDWNNYDLSLEEAAIELSEGRNVIAKEFEDYMDDDSFAGVDELLAHDYSGKSKEEIIDMIRGYYESFGRSKTS